MPFDPMSAVDYDAESPPEEWEDSMKGGYVMGLIAAKKGRGVNPFTPGAPAHGGFVIGLAKGKMALAKNKKGKR